jgi:hypothetical protein
MMLKALDLHAQGRRVQILDRKNQAGGAWITKPVGRFRDVEIGVHLLQNRRLAYEFLETVVGIELVASPRGHLAFLGPLPFSFSLGHLLEHVAYVVRSASRSAGELSSALRGLPPAVASIFEPCRYPPNGCRSITDRLLKLLKDAGIVPTFGVEITRVEIDDDRLGGTCCTTSGELRFRQIVVGSRAHCGIHHRGQRVPVHAPASTSTTFVLHLRGTLRRPFRYVRFWKDDILLRAGNTGRYASPAVDPDEVVVSAHIRPASIKARPAETAGAILAKLISYKLIAPGASVIDFDVDSYPVQTIRDADMDRLERTLAPAVIALKTTDLGWELAEMLRSNGLPGLTSPPRR